MRIHITLDNELSRNPVAKQAVVDELVEKFGLSEVNQKRFERLGVLTGDVGGSESLDGIRSVAGVASVSPDEEKFAL